MTIFILGAITLVTIFIGYVIWSYHYIQKRIASKLHTQLQEHNLALISFSFITGFNQTTSTRYTRVSKGESNVQGVFFISFIEVIYKNSETQGSCIAKVKKLLFIVWSVELLLDQN